MGCHSGSLACSVIGIGNITFCGLKSRLLVELCQVGARRIVGEVTIACAVLDAQSQRGFAVGEAAIVVLALLVAGDTNDIDGDINIILNNVKVDTDSKKIPAVMVYNKDITYDKHKVTIKALKDTKNY